MTDRLDAIAAGLRDGRYDCRVQRDTDDVRWLVAEVRRLRGELQDERLSLAPLREAHAEALNAAAQNEAALAALRQRHAEAVKQLAQLREWKDAACKTMQDYVRSGERYAEAVEKAFRAGYSAGGDDMSAAYHNEYYVGEDAAWLASEAKARLT